MILYFSRNTGSFSDTILKKNGQNRVEIIGILLRDTSVVSTKKITDTRDRQIDRQIEREREREREREEKKSNIIFTKPEDDWVKGN